MAGYPGRHDPSRNEMYCVHRGGGAWLNSRKIHVSHTDRLQDAVVSLSSLPQTWKNAGRPCHCFPLIVPTSEVPALITVPRSCSVIQPAAEST